MFKVDFFGRKARRELESENRRLHAQIEMLRRVAGGLRDRIHSHGAVDAEREFLNACLDIHRNGKQLSQHRFIKSMDAINKERGSLKSWSEGANNGI